MAGDAGRVAGQVQATLLAALRDPARVPELPPRELDLTLRLMRRARLLGRLATAIGPSTLDERLPTTAADQLASAAVAAEARARAARWELDRIAWALSDPPEVPLVALKGCAYLLAGTPNARGRMLNDVDLLVPEDDLPAVESRLEGLGWRRKEVSPYEDNYYRVWAHELPPLRHGEREMEVDLHRGILMRTARLKPSSRLLLEGARSVPGSRFKVLAPADMVLHAMVHLFYGSEMDDAVRELVDIDDLLRHFGEREPGFWEGLWPRAEALDLARPAFYGLRYSRGLLGTPVPDSLIVASRAGALDAAPLWLMDRLVPRALFPQGPDSLDRATTLARLFMYTRSHWVRMPPYMLARHLAYKSNIRFFQRNATAD